MSMMRKLAAGAATVALAACLSTAARAQETSGGINGTVTDAAGHTLANAQVTITYTPTNTVRHVTTDGQGGFSLRGLEPGGPYTITADDAGHTSKTVGDIQIGLGTAYQVSVALDAPIQEVVVRANRGAGVSRTLQTGPRSSFTATDLNTLPSLNRDIKDIARLNPFVTIDPTNANALVIAGNNNRSNTIYVDGAKISDNFGLNANGYPGQRQPIPYDVIQSLNVEIAPTDVQYSSFTGGLLNINTKSGTNEFHGGGFYEYDSSHLGYGQEIRDRQFIFPFVEKDYGLSLQGPIIKDHVFFSFSYEDYQSQLNNSYGTSDSTAVNRVPGVTTNEVNQVSSILQSKYGFDPLGVTVTSPLPVTDQKFFGKLTWQINDKQRLVFEVQDEVGVTVNTNDQSTTARNLSYQSDWYNFDQNIRSYVGTLYSDWTPNFHTEISYDRTEQSNVSNSLAGNDFAYFRVNQATVGAQPGGQLFAGPNVSRQANALTTLDQVGRIRGTYTVGQHSILLGYEREQLDVFNLFVQNANGNYTFNSIADLQAGNAASLTYANAFDNVKNDGAATWGDVVHSFYIQDEWRLRPDLTFKAGLRAELYEQSDKPRNNPYFAQQYGFSNQGTLDGDNVIEPRLGLNYHPDPTLSAYLGAGLYSGGDPNVWVSNDYTNTGNLLGQYSVSCPTPGAATCNPSLLNVNGFQVNPAAQAGNTASANAGTGIVNALSPSFSPPSVWKFTAGFQKTFNLSEFPVVGRYTQFAGQDFAHNAFDGYTVHADYIYQHTNKAPYWYDALDTIGSVTKAPDGRPVYDAARVAPNAATGRLARTNAYDLVLASTDKGFTTDYAIGLRKTFDWGLTADVTYTHVHAVDVNPGTSSVALSNYAQVAFSDPNNQQSGISNYQINQSFKFNVTYSHRIFGDNLTTISLYATKRSGLPYSYTFQATLPNTATQVASTTPLDSQYNTVGAVAQRSNELLYVPKADGTGNVTLTSDPIVQYGPAFANSTYTAANGKVLTGIAGFNQFLKDTGLIKYNGSISPRNAFDSRSVTDADIEISQEIPVFFPYARAKAQVFFDIFNIGNLINSNYGVLEQYGFPYFASDVVALNCQAGAQGNLTANGAPLCTGGASNKYQYQSFTRKLPSITNNANGQPVSAYAFKIGVRYKF